MGNILFVFMVVLMTASAVILDGWVLTYLWDWFIVNTFSLPSLGVAAAIGVAMTVKFITYHGPMPEEKNNPLKSFSVLYLRPLFALAGGWVIWKFFL